MWSTPCGSVTSITLGRASMHHPTLKRHPLLRAWAILWLIAIPLFHIHPEIDPHHGQAGHVHAAAVHTVFSADLDGEFGHHHDQVPATMDPDAGLPLSSGSLHPLTADPEFGFSLLHNSPDRKCFKPGLIHLIFLSHLGLPPPPRPDLTEEEDASTPCPGLVVHEIPARAPPSPSLG